MADKKISALTGATTPLAGTEVLPIVQSGATVKVAVSDLTAGRAVSATQLTSTVAIGTAPLVVTSTTNVANLNASSLNGATFAAPGAIGGGTAAAANFTTVNATGNITNVPTTLADVIENKIQNYGPASQPDGTLLGTYLFTGPSAGYYSGNDAWQWRIGRVAAAGGGGANSKLSVSSTVKSVQTDTEIWYWDSTNNAHISLGNLVIGTSGKGIDFSATSHPAGMTSELLADYEEGTWTPTLGGTATYLAQTGSYTKVGRLVFVRGTLYINAIGTGTTNSLSGLPFTAADAPPITVQIGGSAQAFSAVYGYIGTTNVYITYNAALAVSNQTAANVFTALTYIDFSGCYSV